MTSHIYIFLLSHFRFFTFRISLKQLLICNPPFEVLFNASVAFCHMFNQVFLKHFYGVMRSFSLVCFYFHNRKRRLNVHAINQF